ncbi:maleylpyruvate isomerase family mycothiol-dependent enzyme [Isoptericola croceus]|uniref:maleylpyruvate isomerase family mycothiol-dependent enzyme n=1 Tax=Isoptericola croceus TaxID=3031406 RepID=UPI0023F81737|nr:maleylpyruvate isomerase family mycothiol-dependent enzyme [Isoptericola croceus]
MDQRAIIWDAVHAERRRLARDLERLPAEQWDTPSLCPAWSVHDVLAHLIDSATTTRWGFVRQMVTARFDFDRANDHGVAQHRAADPQHTLEAFRAVIDRTDTPPGPLATRLVEAYVHGEDIRRPLGIEASYPPEHVMAGLEYMARTGARFGGGRERVEGTRLDPTDTDGSIGEGALVRGSAISLLLAASGRPVSPGELNGAGAVCSGDRRPGSMGP